MTYASFWKRGGSCLVDGVIYWILCSIVGQMIGLIFGNLLGVTSSAANDLSRLQILGMGSALIVIQIVCYVLYFVWPESSSWQATIGKRIFGLKVTDLNGQRISFWRSLGRNLGMIISSLILCIGYLMCFWTEKKQCLHDQMAGCLVVDISSTESKSENENKSVSKSEKVAKSIVRGYIEALVLLLVVGGIMHFVVRPDTPKWLKVMSRADTGLILSVQKVMIERKIYWRQHEQHAKNWKDLNYDDRHEREMCFSPDVECSSNNTFKLTLESDGVKAVRINSKEQYELFFPYASDAKVQCFSNTGYCEKFLNGAQKMCSQEERLCKYIKF